MIKIVYWYVLRLMCVIWYGSEVVLFMSVFMNLFQGWQVWIIKLWCQACFHC